MALQPQSPHKPGSMNRIDAVTTWVKEFFEQFQLAWRLLMDGRVPMVPKILPMLTVAYLILPFDFIPDMALGLGQLDDLAILLIGLRLFINVCPQGLVDEHMQALSGDKAVWSPGDGPVIDIDSEVLDAEEDRILEEEEEDV